MDDTERPEKQTSFVSGDADGSVIRASEATPSTVNIGASDEGAKSRAAANAYLRNIDERDLYGASDEVASSAHRIALLIESALRDAQCTEVIAQITSQDAIDGMEEWWLLVYRHLRRRLLTL